MSDDSRSEGTAGEEAGFQEGTMDHQKCTPVLRALSDGTRWRIVQELMNGPCRVTELGIRLSVPQYGISKHIRVLRQAGIIKTDRQGKAVTCELLDSHREKGGHPEKVLNFGCCRFDFGVHMK